VAISGKRLTKLSGRRRSVEVVVAWIAQEPVIVFALACQRVPAGLHLTMESVRFPDTTNFRKIMRVRCIVNSRSSVFCSVGTADLRDGLAVIVATFVCVRSGQS
jgi:hypothetical protein